MKEVSIYTDGSCSNNPGPGGFAAILSCGRNGFDEHTREITGGEPQHDQQPHGVARHRRRPRSDQGRGRDHRLR